MNERAWKEIKEWERPWGAEKYIHLLIVGISPLMLVQMRWTKITFVLGVVNDIVAKSKDKHITWL